MKILNVTEVGRSNGNIRVVASIPNFEEAFFDAEGSKDKPYSALARLQGDETAYAKIAALLNSLINSSFPIPEGGLCWYSTDQLEKAVSEFDSTVTPA